MKKSRLILSRFWQGLPVLFFALAPIGSVRAADANPPQGMTYQGYLVDANSDPLGSPTPSNFDVVFRIYDVEQGGTTDNILWVEQQTVTVDNGYFSVLLGEGSEVGSEPHGAISDVFNSPTASDRFIGITVKNLNGSDATIAPRLRLVTSPYSFLAKHAKSADTIVTGAGAVLTADGQNIGIGQPSPEANLDVNGTVRVRNTAQFDGVTSVGALSVGKSSAPTTPLDVVGRITASGGITAGGVSNLGGPGGFLRILPEAGASYNFDIWSDSFASYVRHNSSARHLIFGANTRNALWIDPDGNVGVDVDPVYKFQVNGVAAANEFRSLGGPIRPAFGGGKTAGILWPDNAAGGSGDYAWIDYTQNVAGQEDTSLNIGIANDGNDDIRFYQQGDIRLQIQDAKVYSHGHLFAPIMYDLNDANYYSDPAYYSRMNVVQMNYLQLIYDANNTAQIWRDDLTLYLGLNSSNHNAGWRYATYNGDSNWDFSSDRRLKKDIEDAETVLGKVMDIQVRRFRFKDGVNDEGYKEIGVIAQELEGIFPDLVTDVKVPDSEDSFLSVGYTSFGIIGIKAIQELKQEKDQEIQGLKDDIQDLKRQIQELKALINN